jgi:hypothetical protein
MYLLAKNFKAFEMRTELGTKAVPAVSPMNLDFSDVYCSLIVEGDEYNAFVQHVDGIFCQAVVDCYGHFVSLTEPIVSQTQVVHIVELFKSKFQAQYWAIAVYIDHVYLAEEYKVQQQFLSHLAAMDRAL